MQMFKTKRIFSVELWSFLWCFQWFSSHTIKPIASKCVQLPCVGQLTDSHCMQADPIGRIVFFERVKLEVIQELPRNNGNWAWQKETCQWRWCWLRHSTKSSVPSWEWRLMGSDMFAQVESISGQLRILGRRVTIPKLESLRMELSAARLLGCYRMP